MPLSRHSVSPPYAGTMQPDSGEYFVGTARKAPSEWYCQSKS
jgi:hypothetical protein